MIIKHARDPSNCDLFQTSLIRIAGLSVVFQITVPSRIYTSGHLGIKHRGADTGKTGCIDYGVNVALRGPYLTEAELGANDYALIPFNCFDSNPKFKSIGCDGGNILNLEQHYATAHLNGASESLSMGFYRVEVLASSKSDAYPGFDGLSEVLQETVRMNLITATMVPE